MSFLVDYAQGHSMCKNKKIRYLCAGCEEPTHFLLLNKDLCPHCYTLNVTKLDVEVVEKKNDRTVH
jgi:hypothetical protein